MTDDEFLKSLSTAEWDEGEAIEAEIGKLLQQGFTEALGIKFVRTVLEIRRKIPRAAVGRVFDAALDFGLSYWRFELGIDPISPIGSARSIKQKKMRRGKLAGAGI